MAERIEYVPLLPKEPPADLIEWAQREGALKDELLVYRSAYRYLPLEERSEECVEVTCSACGNTFTADKIRSGGCRSGYAPAPFGWFNHMMGEAVISGSPTICPYCGGEMDTRHIGNIGQFGASKQAFVAAFYRLQVPGKRDRLCIVDWMIEKTIDKKAQTSYSVQLWTAWVVEEKKIVRIMGYHRWMSGLIRHRPEQRRNFRDDFGVAQLVYPWDPKILEGTTAENSKLDLYIDAGGMRLVAYLGLYVKRPHVENLVMQGFAPLVKDLINAECERSAYEASGGYPRLTEWINWKEKRPTKMLGMTKEQAKVFRQHDWGKRELSVIAWSQASGIPMEWPADVERLCALGTYEGKQILDGQGVSGFWKTVRYLDKGNHDYRYLCDYWNMAERLDMDVDDPQVKWPKDLRAAHNKAVERYNAKKEELDAEAFRRRADELRHLCWESDGLMIRPCATANELRAEGKELHHCVATYAERHAEGKTAIFFIRRVDKPDEPYYTLELDEKELSVRQNRGLRNCGKTDEVQAFENAWLDWAKNKTLKKKRKGKAA